MTELTKKQEDFLREYVFFDGWDDPSKLNYLPKDKIESYEKVHSIDHFEYFKWIFMSLELYKIESNWFKDIFLPVLPTTDKEIEYFIENNYSYRFLSMVASTHISEEYKKRKKKKKEIQKRIERTQIKIDYNQRKIEEYNAKAEALEQEALNQYAKGFKEMIKGLSYLKERGNDQANEFVKFSMQELSDIVVRDKTKPKGSSKKTIKRDDDIRAKYVKMESEGLTHKHIQKTLGEEYGKEPSTIKAIYYKYDYTQKEQGD